MFRLNNIGLILVCFFCISCRKDKPSFLLYEKPNHFPKPFFEFKNFDFSKNKVELGKKLFYDPILSSDNSISCASCHDKKYGFSDPFKVLSLGVNDSLTERNSTALVNLAWNTSFFWDGGVNHLEVTSFAPITNPLEMNEDMSNIVSKLNNHAEYPTHFKIAFGNEFITDQSILWALAAYMANLVSADSKYDRVYNGKEKFSSNEKKGYEIFLRDCASCHKEPLLSDFQFHNNGLDSIFNDNGRERITLNPYDKGKFKTPSLRNISLTAPYMHDGRFNTLIEVINHYSEGIKLSQTLSSKLGVGFNYSNEEKLALLNFLETLTDFNYVSNPNF